MPTWLPPGALAHINPIAGNYYAGGAERAVGDVLGGDFDPASISANGMRHDAVSGGNKPQAIGPFLDHLLGYFIAVITYKADNPAQGNNNLLTVYDSVQRNGGFEAYFYNGNGELFGGSNVFTSAGSGNADESEVAGAPGDVIKTVSVHDNGLVAVSSQGHPLIAGGHSLLLPTRTIAYIGHVGQGATGAFSGWTREITIYPAPTALI